MTAKPKISDDPMYLLLRDGKIGEFNRRKRAGEGPQLRDCDFSGLDLRGLDADGLDLSGAFLHQTDIRGVDMTTASLEGASINGAHIAGAYFPQELGPQEIELSLLHGTRMRYRS
jgi:uncharacterized protein YjbI with pentapeptide repeats